MERDSKCLRSKFPNVDSKERSRCMSQFKKEHVQDMYFLSPMQEGMLFHYLLEQGQSKLLDFEQMSIRVRGTLDIGLFSVSLNRIAQRYDVFRTVFLYEKVKRPVQVVLKERQIQVHFENVSSLPEQERSLFVERFKQEDLERGFDLSKDMMMRVSVIQTGESEYQIFWSHHHILMDGWCLGIIVGELFQIYATLREPAPIQLERAYPYSDYIKWLERQDKEEAKRFWAEALFGYEQLASVPQKTAATTDIARSGYKLEELTIRFDEKLTAKLQQPASEHQVTLNTVFQTIWGIVLQRYSHANDVVFGSVVSGRPSQVIGIEKMVVYSLIRCPVPREVVSESIILGCAAKEFSTVRWLPNRTPTCRLLRFRRKAYLRVICSIIFSFSKTIRWKSRYKMDPLKANWDLKQRM